MRSPKKSPPTDKAAKTPAPESLLDVKAIVDVLSLDLKAKSTHEAFAKLLLSWTQLPSPNVRKSSIFLGRFLWFVLSSPNSETEDAESSLGDPNSKPESADDLKPEEVSTDHSNGMELMSATKLRGSLDPEDVLILLYESILAAQRNYEVITVLIKGMCHAKGKFPNELITSVREHSIVLSYEDHLGQIPIGLWIPFSEFWQFDILEISQESLLSGYAESIGNERWEDAKVAIRDFRLWTISGFDPDVFLRDAPLSAISPILRVVDDEAFKRRAINVMSKVKEKEKFAGQLVKKCGFHPDEFPELVRKREENTVNYYLYSIKMSVPKVVDILEGHDSMLVYLATLLWNAFNVGRSNAKAIHLHYTLTKIPDQSMIPTFIREGFAPTQQNPRFQDAYLVFELELDATPVFPAKHGTKCPPSSTVLEGGCLNLEQIGFDPNRDLVWVDRLEQLESILEEIQKPGSWVCVDAEWRPHATVFSTSSVALLQLSVVGSNTNIYLIDLATMGRDADPLIAQFLANKEVVKVGVHFMASDWCEFQKQSSAYTMIHSYIDFPALVTSIPVVAKTFLSSLSETEATPTTHLSLARASQLILNTPMDKSLQITNWEKRPLEYACACYASLDVAALVKMLDVILDKTGIQDLDTLQHLYKRSTAHHERAQDSGTSPKKSAEGSSSSASPPQESAREESGAYISRMSEHFHELKQTSTCTN